MALRNCINCGTLFNAPHSGIRLCAQCEKEEQERFERVKTFIKENPGATALTIIKKTGVERKELYDWVRSGRIDVAGMDGLGLTCESCGTPIDSGRLCTECGLRMQEDARRALGSKSPGQRTQKDDERRGGGFYVRNSVLRRRRRD
ncbi:MAG: hypothetical protein GX316_03115 [Firmicutes bacterium]|nr:hypothetical protein [Bacillota bacterium]